MKCAPKKDKGIRVLIWSWSQQAVSGKKEQQEASLPSAESKWIWLLNRSSGVHLECPWNYTFFPLSRRLMLLKKLCWSKEKHIFHWKNPTCFILFFEYLEFHLYFIQPRITLYFSPSSILEFQWSLSRQKFSRTVFKGKSNFSLSEKHCIL